MPSYDYQCPICKTIIEKWHSITHDPEYFCKKCGHKLDRLITKTNRLEFIGEGFYCNDYGKKSSKDS